MTLVIVDELHPHGSTVCLFSGNLSFGPCHYHWVDLLDRRSSTDDCLAFLNGQKEVVFVVRRTSLIRAAVGAVRIDDDLRWMLLVFETVLTQIEYFMRISFFEA